MNIWRAASGKPTGALYLDAALVEPALLADYPEAGLAPGSLPAAFSPETSNPFHLLDPRLDVAPPESGRDGSG